MGDLLHPDPLQFLLINVEGQKKVLTLASFEVRTLLCLTLKNKMSLLVIVCQFMFKLFPVQLLSGEPKWRESVHEVLVLQFCIKSLRSLLVPSCTLPALTGAFQLCIADEKSAVQTTEFSMRQFSD